MDSNGWVFLGIHVARSNPSWIDPRPGATEPDAELELESGDSCTCQSSEETLAASPRPFVGVGHRRKKADTTF